MKDIVILHPETKRVVRANANLLGTEVFWRCVAECTVGGLESVAYYLNSVGIWARVAEFSATGATFKL